MISARTEEIFVGNCAGQERSIDGDTTWTFEFRYAKPS